MVGGTVSGGGCRGCQRLFSDNLDCLVAVGHDDVDTGAEIGEAHGGVTADGGYGCELVAGGVEQVDTGEPRRSDNYRGVVDEAEGEVVGIEVGSVDRAVFALFEIDMRHLGTGNVETIKLLGADNNFVIGEIDHGLVGKGIAVDGAIHLVDLDEGDDIVGLLGLDSVAQRHRKERHTECEKYFFLLLSDKTF